LTSNLAPFASFIAMQSVRSDPDPDLLFIEIITAIDPSDSFEEKEIDVDIPAAAGISPSFAISIAEERKVGWDGSGTLTDRLNHLLIGFVSENIALIYMSDSRLKLKIQDALIKQQIGGWRGLEQSILNTAFLTGQKLRALWLGGTHRSVDFRPDTKVMSGQDLREAIDPFGDSSFMPSAARSPKAGVSLSRSGVWKGAKSNWAQFCENARLIFLDVQSALAAGALTQEIHPFLARLCEDLSGVSDAYDLCFADEEILETAGALYERLKELQNYEIRLLPLRTVNSHIAVINVDHIPTGESTTIEVKPGLAGERIFFELTLAGDTLSSLHRFKELIETSPELLRIYYDSGHVISSATLSQAAIQDNEFTYFVDGDFEVSAPFPKVALKDEKPAGSNMRAWLVAMTTASDDSLFSWVRHRGISQLSLPQPAPGTTWLLCDDGAGEIADFIHIHAPSGGIPIVTAIHVKGANNGDASRQISVSAFEVVVGQAIKNLRQILGKRILEKIANAIAGGDESRVWDSPWPAATSNQARRDLRDALRRCGANCRYEVVVVQPHVRRTHYDAVVNQVKAKKLRTLLFGALVMARSADARFRVVIDGS